MDTFFGNPHNARQIWCAKLWPWSDSRDILERFLKTWRCSRRHLDGYSMKYPNKIEKGQRKFRNKFNVYNQSSSRRKASQTNSSEDLSPPSGRCLRQVGRCCWVKELFTSGTNQYRTRLKRLIFSAGAPPCSIIFAASDSSASIAPWVNPAVFSTLSFR